MTVCPQKSQLPSLSFSFQFHRMVIIIPSPTFWLIVFHLTNFPAMSSFHFFLQRQHTILLACSALSKTAPDPVSGERIGHALLCPLQVTLPVTPAHSRGMPFSPEKFQMERMKSDLKYHLRVTLAPYPSQNKRRTAQLCVV